MAQQNYQQNQQQKAQAQELPKVEEIVRKGIVCNEVPTAVEGMIYTSKDGAYKHVKAGADCSDMTPEDLKAAIASKHVEVKLVKVDQ